MAKYELLIKAVTVQGLSYAETARRYGVSKALVHKLHHRWLAEGDAAFEARSRRPVSSPNRTPDGVRERILQLRDELVRHGVDAGADTISAHLAREHVVVSRVTVWRILTAAGRVTPQPQKRPRASWRRFAADRPNELWQSDFTHITLTNGDDVEVIGWLDDHSRYLLHLTAHRRVTGPTPGGCATTPIDRDGKISLRHSGRMLHLGIGRAHARTEIACLIHNEHATVISTSTGEVLGEYTLDPTHSYQRKNG